MDFLILFIGFYALVKGADLFVDGASKYASFFKIPSIIVGLTIVSIGTSLPEASVAINAGILGSSDIGLGNIIGSNIFNTAIVLGFCAFCKPIFTDSSLIKKDFPFLFFVSAVTVLLMLNGTISLLDAIFLLCIFVYFISSQVFSALKSSKLSTEEPEKINFLRSTLSLIVGFFLIYLGGELVVSSATSIAESFGVSEKIIGLTVVALGTSLPELVTSVVATKKGEISMAVGNVIGSNICNLVFILGIGALFTPITVDSFALIDMFIFIAICIFTYVSLILNKSLGKFSAVVLILSYVAFNAYIFIR